MRTAQEETSCSSTQQVRGDFLLLPLPRETLVQGGTFRDIGDKTFSLCLHLPSPPMPHLISHKRTLCSSSAY